MLPVVAIAGVLGAIVWAVTIVGTPRMARMRELDEARVANLQEIRGEIGRFYRDQGRLPDALQDLSLDPDTLRDPETHEFYGYVVEDTRTYKLSAQFALASDEKHGWHDVEWSHGTGVHQFSFVIPDDRNQRPRAPLRLMSESLN